MEETQEMQLQSLGGEDSLAKEMATHASIPAWKMPWAGEPGRPTVHGATKSWTWLNDKHTHNNTSPGGLWNSAEWNWWAIELSFHVEFAYIPGTHWIEVKSPLKTTQSENTLNYGFELSFLKSRVEFAL